MTPLCEASAPGAAWSVAVFAYNEAGRIRAALESIPQAAGGNPVDIVVLANGCTDRTVDEVRACAGRIPRLWLAEIDLADKAHAWNCYVHDLPPPFGPGARHVHFFMDGDVRLGPNALALLAATLEDMPGVRAAGGMPATGRDRDAWRRRMVSTGILAGGLYALRGSFVDSLRGLGVRLPIGFIGEDWLVSRLALMQNGSETVPSGGPPVVFNQDAEFAFRSLSLTRPSDYALYLRRKWRYAQRALQFEMLMNMLVRDGLTAMPADVRTLYLNAPLPGRLRWAGWDTPLRLLALQKIRTFRSRVNRS